jgi:hypothetical protein
VAALIFCRRLAESVFTVTPLIIPLNITNKKQHYTIFFITVNAPWVSGGFSAHHQQKPPETCGALTVMKNIV